MVQIIPAILATTEEEYRSQLSKITDSGLFDEGWVHVDFMDNIFVQNKSIELDILEKYSISLVAEAHLMVKSPTSFITRLSLFKFKRVIFHFEADNPKDIISQIKQRQMEVGIAINPETDLSAVEVMLKEIDVLLIMSIHPGFQGQEFILKTIDKIKEAAKLRSENNLKFLIEVDGGVTAENAASLKEAGVDLLVIGSHLTKGDIEENLENIWEKLQS